MIELRGSLAGADFVFRCDHAAVSEYARRHLGALLGTTGAPKITAVLRWHEGQPPLGEIRHDPTLARMTRVDRDLYRDDGELCWLRVDDLRDLLLRMRWDGDRLDVEGDFYFRLGNRPLSDHLRRIRQWRQRPHLERRRFPTLLAYLVYYPCWWWLERKHRFHPIHAAGVALGSRVVLLAGASGVGKSTLAVALAAEADARLLSDSFVLHNGAQVRPVREPILVDDWSRRWLGPRAATLQPLDWEYVLQRRGFQVDPQRRSDGGTAALLLFPRRAPQAFCRPIAPERAHQWLSAADLLINDLRRYWAFAAVLEQLDPCGLVARRETELERLSRSVPSVELGLTSSAGCDDTIADIRRLLGDASTTHAADRMGS